MESSKEQKAKYRLAREKWERNNPGYFKKYREQNKEAAKGYNRKYSLTKRQAKLSDFYNNNPDKIFRLDSIDIKFRLSIMTNDQRIGYNEKREKASKEKSKEKSKAYYLRTRKLKNRGVVNIGETRNTYTKISSELRKRTTTALKRTRWVKDGGTETLLGGGLNTVRSHIESLFYSDMNWDNHGYIWHVDHVIPLSSAIEKSDLIGLCHYLNLQPLLVNDNISKSDMMPWDWVISPENLENKVGASS